MEFTTFLRELDAALADLPLRRPRAFGSFTANSTSMPWKTANPKRRRSPPSGISGKSGIKPSRSLPSPRTRQGVPTAGSPMPSPRLFSRSRGRRSRRRIPPLPKNRMPAKSCSGACSPLSSLSASPLAAAAAVLYLAAWVVLASLWVVTGSCGFAAVWGLASSFYILTSSIPVGLFQLGTAVLAGGLGILFGVASLVLCRLFARASAAMFRGIRSLAGRRHSVLPSPAVPDTH